MVAVAIDVAAKTLSFSYGQKQMDLVYEVQEEPLLVYLSSKKQWRSK